LLEEAERRAIVAQARERLAHELSDGVIQRLYGVGLLLGGLAGQLPPSDPIHAALRELDESITALRAMILDARLDPGIAPRSRPATTDPSCDSPSDRYRLRGRPEDARS
jgi:signal transduction histidine kinase